MDSVPPPTACTPPDVWNEDVCGCAGCDRTCIAPFVLNQGKCKCECGELSCPNTQRPNRVDCICEDRCPGVTCGPLHTLNLDNCRCQCTAFLNCPPGEIFNFDTCTCDSICGGISCEEGFTLNPNKCKCKCDLKARDCGEGESFDPNTCSCEACPPCSDPTEVQDKYCQCYGEDCDHISCSEGLTLKSTGKKCKCVCERKRCGRRERWDSKACVCVPKVFF